MNPSRTHSFPPPGSAILALAALALATVPAGAQSVPVESLVGFYSFDDPDDPLADDSGNNQDLYSADAVPSADPVYQESGGFRGGAYHFNGQQRIVSPVEINPFVLPDMTMGAWVRTDSLAGGLRKIIGSDDGGWDRTIGLDDREAPAPLRYTSFIGNGPPLLGTPGPVNTEDWTFVAAVYTTVPDGVDGEVTVYVDLNANTTSDALVAVSGPTVFGDGFFETSIGSLRRDAANEGWVGSIDNPFFFDVALSAEQLTLIRNAGTPMPSEGDDPDLLVTAEPPLSDLPRDPNVRELVYGVRNGGLTQTLEISGVTLSGADFAAGHYSVTSFPAMLGPGESGSVVLSFDSKGQVGAFACLVTIASNDESDATVTRDASATVAAVEPRDPVLTVVTDPVFGELPAGPGTVVRMIEITNGGAAADLTIVSAGLLGTNAGNFSVGALPGPVAPGGTGMIEVTLDPQGAIGVFGAQLRLVSNDSAGRFTTIVLDARIPPASLRDALLGFYPFDEADPRADLSGNGNNLIEGAGAEPFYEPAGGFEGGAYDYLGSNLVAPIDINPAVQPELTMGAWVKASIDIVDVPGLYKILGSDNGGWDRTIGLDNRIEAGDPPLRSRYTSFVGYRRPVEGTPELMNADDWTFVAATYSESTDVVTVYVDLDVSTTDDPLVAVSEPSNFNPSFDSVSIGSLSPTNTAESWVGKIDNVFFYGFVLSPEELADIRTRGRDAILGNEPVDSRLWFTSVEIDDGNVVLEWEEQNAPGPYLVERLDDPAIGWQDLADGVPAKTFTDSTAGGVRVRIYRVSQE